MTLCRAGGIILLLGLSTVATAQDVPRLHLELNQAATDAGLSGDDLEGELNSLVGQQLKMDDVQAFMDGMANAAAMANKGMGADYASNIEKFEIGGSVSSAVHGGGVSFVKGPDTLPEGGFAAQITFMGGVNLGLAASEKKAFGKRFRLYVNALSMNMPGNREFSGRMYNVGGHLQIKLVRGINAKITEWGGIDITSGYEYSGYTLSLDKTLPLEVPFDGGTVTWTADGQHSLASSVQSIPVELSTNFRVAVITAYAGGALDVSTGSSDLSTALDGPVNATIDPVLKNDNIGSAGLDFTGSGVADQYVPRIFAGAQANILMFKAFAHLNVGFNGTVGGHIGARVAI